MQSCSDFSIEPSGRVSATPEARQVYSLYQSCDFSVASDIEDFSATAVSPNPVLSAYSNCSFEPGIDFSVASDFQRDLTVNIPTNPDGSNFGLGVGRIS